MLGMGPAHTQWQAQAPAHLVGRRCRAACCCLDAAGCALGREALRGWAAARACALQVAAAAMAALILTRGGNARAGGQRWGASAAGRRGRLRVWLARVQAYLLWLEPIGSVWGTAGASRGLLMARHAGGTPADRAPLAAAAAAWRRQLCARAALCRLPSPSVFIPPPSNTLRLSHAFQGDVAPQCAQHPAPPLARSLHVPRRPCTAEAFPEPSLPLARCRHCSKPVHFALDAADRQQGAPQTCALLCQPAVPPPPASLSTATAVPPTACGPVDIMLPTPSLTAANRPQD